MLTAERISRVPLEKGEKKPLPKDLFGTPNSVVTFMGLAGTDVYAEANGTPLLSSESLPKGGKRNMTPDVRSQLLKQHSITIDSGRSGVGQTGANAVSAFSKYGYPTEFHLPLAVGDESSQIIIMTLEYARVKLAPTWYEGYNPSGVHVIWPDGQKTALLDKNVPPIETKFHPDTGFIMLAATGTNWDLDWRKAITYARENKIPYGILGSESQLKEIQIHDEMSKIAKKRAQEKRNTYLEAISGATIWLGNDDEAQIIVQASGQTPSNDPLSLAQQMRSAAKDNLPFCSITFGPGLSTLLAFDDLHTLLSGTVKAKNTAGAGDQYAAALFAKLREPNNFDLHGIGRAMIEAAYATIDVVSVDDTMSGQMTRERSDRLGFKYMPEDLLEHLGFQHSIIKLP